MTAVPPTIREDPALSLTAALILSSPNPLLLLDSDLCIVSASGSFCGLFGVDPAVAPGGSLFELGDGEWNVPQLRALRAEVASGTAQFATFEMELERPAIEKRCLVINTRRVDYRDLNQPRLLMAIADVTDARSCELAKNEVIKQLGVLLLDVRHRVANSLQIVSSILLQGARRSSSTETRDSLTDAHHRVMSVAALERQLSTNNEGGSGVEVSSYFRALCGHIGGSMLANQSAVTLVVTGSGLVTPRVSVSLGLIVTELIINALKHAFPDGRTGKVEIGYQAEGPNWKLSVSDDGVGMPVDLKDIQTGLGTGVVQALARQLEASVVVAPGTPGTVVSIEHIQVALVSGDLGRTRAARSSNNRPTSPERPIPRRSNARG